MKDIKNSKEDMKELKEYAKFLFKAKQHDEDIYVYGSYVYSIGSITGSNPFSLESARRVHQIIDLNKDVWYIDIDTLEQVK